eukprot:Nitzschia sp. Nitz4//scaffold16_size188269//63963//65285//NITZ4_001788-RA/size188269-processed-gene-0.12-mRNA-1//1//CDS//3329538508//7632//frame0
MSATTGSTRASNATTTSATASRRHAIWSLGVLILIGQSLIFWRLRPVLPSLADVAMSPSSASSTSRGGSVSGAPITFVFVIGLEGTGHHLLSALARASPSTLWYQQRGIHPTQTRDLAKALLDEDTLESLFNVHCQTARQSSLSMQKDTVSTAAMEVKKKAVNSYVAQRAQAMKKQQEQQQGNHRRLASNQQPVRSVIAPNTVQLQFRVVDILRRIQRQVVQEQSRSNNNNNNDHDHVDNDDPPPKYFLINSGASSPSSTGQLSFPNSKGLCRNVNFPNLDLLYGACQQAQVACRHVYLHRDPVAVLRSTTISRLYNPTVLAAIHLYTTQLRVIYTLLETHADKTLGCWDLLSSPASDSPSDALTKHPNARTTGLSVHQLLGWTDYSEFSLFLESVYRAPAPLTESERDAIVPSNLRPYYQSLQQRHLDVQSLCQRQLSG